MRASSVWGKIQRNYLPILSGLLFLFILGVLIIEIDRQVYQSKKKEICWRDWPLCSPSLLEQLEKAAGSYFGRIDDMRVETALRAQLAVLAQAALKTMDAESSRILNADNCLISISVYAFEPGGEKGAAPPVFSRMVDKYALLNTFDNSLILKHFWGETALTFKSSYPPHYLIGKVFIRYTTPKDNPDIRRLTRTYWGYLGGLVVTLSLLYWYILRHLIMPIKIVTSCVDRSKGALPEVLRRPGSLLEAAYNDLARDALLNALRRTMAEYMSVDRLVSHEEIVGSLPQRIATDFGFAAVYAVELTMENNAEPTVLWSRTGFPGRQPLDLPKPADSDWIALAGQLRLDTRYRVLDFAAGLQRPRPHFAVPVALDGEARRVAILAATPPNPLTHDSVHWNRETLLRVAEVVRAGLETLDLQRDLIAREKSKANISLSRSLGHDLTNVVATSKLDLDTVRRFLNLPRDRQAQMDPPMLALFTDALQGLLNNTKFLQEVINIYRAFSYIHHPQYELVSINALCDEVADLFQLSLSRRIQMARSYDDGLPMTYVEPRLLKLALFNLLTNATDALKRRATQEDNFGARLAISTRFDGASGTLTITVRDNGDGIRNPGGDLAGPDEVRRILRGGFTTKREGMAEGLGLNWVRQIVHDFHHGQLHGRNHPEGGAEVSVVLPILESPPSGNGGIISDEAQPASAAHLPSTGEVETR